MQVKKIPIFIFFWLLLWGTIWEQPTLAQSNQGQVVILVLDAVSLSDLVAASTPNIDSLADKGAIGLLNTTTAGGAARIAAHLTLGTGTRAAGPDTIDPVLAWDEIWEGDLAKEVYQRRTRLEPPGRILNLAIGQLLATNAQVLAPVQVGLLGQSLADAGLDRVLLGNADRADTAFRPSAAIIMDSSGSVDRGAVGGEVLKKDPTAPYGLRTDGAALLEKYKEMAGSSAVVVIEWGDTSRADFYTSFTLPNGGNNHLQEAVEAADMFLGNFLDGFDLEKNLLLIVVPSPSQEKYRKGDRLTPLVVVGKGITPGLLTSATTRRAGLVANTDLAPSILDFFDLPPLHTVTGRPIGVVSREDPIEELLTIQEIAFLNFRLRPNVIKSYIVFILFVLSGTTLSIYKKIPWGFLWRPLLLAVPAIPVALLLLSISPPGNQLGTYLAIVLLTVFLVALISRRQEGLKPVVVLSFITLLLLTSDLLLGQPLIKNSIFGYCPISGARYYGLGNEYMGVLLGASLVAVTGLADIFYLKENRKGLFLLFLGGIWIIALMGFPNLGANLGGTIAATGGFTITLFHLRKGVLHRRHLFLLPLCLLLLLSLVWFGDFRSAENSASHLGRTIALVLGEGPDALVPIFLRKWGMNLRLLKYSWWSMVLLLSLLVFLIFSYRPPQPIQKVKSAYPFLWTGLLGGAVAALLALIANDSGVVGAATTLIFPVSTLLFLLVQETK